mmetsp:Transcript_6898/g.15179  ORF Transcript_6898/g.15179 Transcript_6898/m.15179 type:complete len:205 (-) Transcript_6898:54-668(-)
MVAPIVLPLGFMFLASRSRSPLALCQRASRASDSMLRLASSASKEAISSLPPLVSADGSAVPPTSLPDVLSGKRVALYFAAGWCPMCTRFEPSLLQFRDAAKESDKPLEIIYVPSDRSSDEALARASTMNMMSVPFGEADAVKRQHNIWSGAETMKLGSGRRSGVPALVVLNGKSGEEMTFVAAEAEGVKALSSWPLDDESGVW